MPLHPPCAWLAGALMVASVADGRSPPYGRPFLGIHHLKDIWPQCVSTGAPSAPYLVLLVSGGHTELIRFEATGAMRRLGRSHDDAAGEAFDKVARLLGFGYPGGPAIQRAAKGGDPSCFRLPKGRISLPGGGFHPFDFSFSGLKTAMLRTVEQLQSEGGDLPLQDLAASFEQVVVDVLVERSLRIWRLRGSTIWSLWVEGGEPTPAAMVQQQAAARVDVSIAPLAYCTDNAAMIGAAALRLEQAPVVSAMDIGVSARWPSRNRRICACPRRSDQTLGFRSLATRVWAEPYSTSSPNRLIRRSSMLETGFTPQAEIWNGRLAMIGLSAGLAVVLLVRLLSGS